MTNELPELLPCPFCGGKADIERWHGGGPQKRMISCSNMYCEANPHVTGKTKKKAIGAWNARAAVEQAGGGEVAGYVYSDDLAAIKNGTLGGFTYLWGRPTGQAGTPVYVAPPTASAGVTEALHEAEQSLRAIANGAGRMEYMDTFDEVRGFANSRANVALAAFSAAKGADNDH